MILALSGKLGSGKDEVANIIQYLCYEKYVNAQGKELDMSLGYFKNFPQRKKNNLSGFLIKRFADKLKDTVCLWLGCTREQLENREFKEKSLGEEWHVWWTQHKNNSKKIFSSEQNRNGYLAHLNEDHYQIWEDTSYGDYRLTSRKLMQLLGTEAGREIIHPNIWVNSLFADYIPNPKKVDDTGIPHSGDYPKWIIPDTRFPNELQAVKDRDGITIRIERPINLRFPKLWKLYTSSNKYVKKAGEFLAWLSGHDRDMYEKLNHPSETALDNYDDWDYVIHNNFSMETLIKSVKEILEDESII